MNIILTFLPFPKPGSQTTYPAKLCISLDTIYIGMIAVAMVEGYSFILKTQYSIPTVQNYTSHLILKLYGSSYLFYIACVYNPSPDNEKYYKAMLNNFENVLKKNKEIVIVRNLNINYDLDEKKYNNQAHYIEMWLNCRQLILEPTRVTLNILHPLLLIYTQRCRIIMYNPVF